MPIPLTTFPYIYFTIFIDKLPIFINVIWGQQDYGRYGDFWRNQILDIPILLELLFGLNMF